MAGDFLSATWGYLCVAEMWHWLVALNHLESMWSTQRADRLNQELLNPHTRDVSGEAAILQYRLSSPSRKAIE